MTFDETDITRLAGVLRPIVREEVQNAITEHAETLANPKPWMSRRELAGHFGVNDHVVRDCEDRGDIIGIRVGRQARYKLSEVEQAFRQSGTLQEIEEDLP
jgi:hypothetical protein